MELGKGFKSKRFRNVISADSLNLKVGLRFRDKTNGNCGIKLVSVPINSFWKSVESFHFVPPLVHSPREFIWTWTSESPMAPTYRFHFLFLWYLGFYLFIYFSSQNDNKNEQLLASIMSLIRGSIQKNLCFF